MAPDQLDSTTAVPESPHPQKTRSSSYLLPSPSPSLSFTQLCLLLCLFSRRSRRYRSKTTDLLISSLGLAMLCLSLRFLLARAIVSCLRTILLFIIMLHLDLVKIVTPASLAPLPSAFTALVLVLHQDLSRINGLAPISRSRPTTPPLTPPKY